MAARAQLAPERRTLIQRCLDDGWSWHQIKLTHGVCWNTMKRHFDGTQWDQVEGARLGAAVRHSKNPRVTRK